MSIRYSLLTVAGAFLLAACGAEMAEAPEPEAPAADAAQEEAAPAAEPAAEPAGDGGLPARVVAERGGFIPEGVEYDQANGRLLTGSIAEGTIFEIHADGSMTAAVSDPELGATIGIEADEPRDRLLVANSGGFGEAPGQAMLGVYSLTTGERIAMVDLMATLGELPEGATVFANDVTVAEDGTVYATDTRMNVVYQVDGDYNASVMHAFEGIEGMALNGLVHHPDGYLLVADLGNGGIYRIPVDDPAAASEVSLPEPMSGADGLVWDSAGNLVVVSNSSGMITALTSDDGWASATIAAVGLYEGQATTGAAVGDDIYIVHPFFQDPEALPIIERVTFQ